MQKSIFRGFKTKALALSVSAIAAGLVMSPVINAAEALEEIQITGSRVRTTDGMAAPTPVTAITLTELTDIDPGGIVSEQLGTLPQFFGTQSAQRGGGALFGSAGGSFLNMRSLGANRTLVLLDGSRVVPGDKAGSVNVDTLPTALIRTVDVVTGGASAAYGADALGGVTNFIIDRQFQGLKISTGTGITEVGDGQRYNFSVAGGKQFGERLNVIASFDSKYINQIERQPETLSSDFYKRWGHVTNPKFVSFAATPGVPQRLTLPWVTSSLTSPYGLIVSPGVGTPSLLTPNFYTAAQNTAFLASGLNRMRFTPDGANITPFINGDVTAIGGTQSMSGGPESIIHNHAFGAGGINGAEVVGRSGFVGLQYDLTDNITVFGQALAGRSESNNEDGRSNYELGGLGNATVFQDNAYLPANVKAAMVAGNIPFLSVGKLGSFYGVPEIGANERDHNVLSTQSWSVGFSADLPNDFTLSGNIQSGESEKKSQVYEKTRVDRMFLAMDAVRNPAGAIVCRVTTVNPTLAQLAAAPVVQGKFTDTSDWRIASAQQSGQPAPARVPLPSPIGTDAGTISGCVPYNVMGNGNISAAAIDYIGTDKFGIGHINQDFAEVLLQGEVYEGWGYGPVSFAGGVNYREQSMTDGATTEGGQIVEDVGPPLNAPELGIKGVGHNYTTGSANMHAFSTVPLLAGGYDVTEYFGELQAPIWESTSGNQSVGGSMAARRSDYSRTGKIDTWKIGLEFEVFADLRVRATKSLDVREPTFTERLDAQGGGGTVNDPARNGASTSITTVSGGNPNLKPERANTVVAGIVYQPSWLDGLQISTDWYQVEIIDAVGSLGAQRITDECYAGVKEQCQFIERDAGGGLQKVFNYFQNSASARVEGVDFEGSYRTEPDFFASEFESFSVRGLMGYIIERSNVSSPGAVSTHIEGGTGTPQFTSLITSTYSLGSMSFMLQGRYIDNTVLNTTWIEGRDVDDNSVASNSWFNGQLGYNGEMSNGSTWNASFNVQNLLDRTPPIVASFGNRGGSQSLSDNYDLEGRRYQLSLNYNF